MFEESLFDKVKDILIGLGAGLLLSLVAALLFYLLLWPPMKEIFVLAGTQTQLSIECAELGYPDSSVRNINANPEGWQFYCEGLVDGTSVVVPLGEARGGE